MNNTHFYKRLIALIMLFSMPFATSAANLQGVVSGKVLNVATHLESWNSTDYNQNVVTSITISGLPKAEIGVNGCVSANGYGRVAITKENPAYEQIFATALTAKASDTTVKVHYLDTCTVRSNSWDLAIITLE